MQDIYFKEGDKVCCQWQGNGIIKEIAEDGTYPVKADFNGAIEGFTLDGRCQVGERYPSLLQGHDRFIKEPNKPIFEPKYGELVWAKVNDCWCVYYYDKPHESINGHYEVKIDPQHTKGFYLASQIRPFKGEIPND